MKRQGQPANRAAVLKELHRVSDEYASLRFVPTWIESEIEPAGEPVQDFGRRAAHVKQNLRRGNLVLERGIEPFEVGEESIEERSRLLVFAIDRRQVIRQVRKARIISAQGGHARRGTLVTAQHQLQLQIPAARSLEQHLPGTVANPAGRRRWSIPRLFPAQKRNLCSIRAQVWSGLSLPWR